MKHMILGLALATGFIMTTGCAATLHAQEVVVGSDVGAQVSFPTGTSQYGCIVVVDQMGEHQVCSNYYIANGNYVYWDAFYGSWIYSGGGYWTGGRYYHGFIPGYYDHYRSFYHPRGWHEQHGWVRNGNGYHPQTFNHGQYTQPQHYSAPQQHYAPQQHTQQHAAPQSHGGSVGHSGGSGGAHGGGGGHGGGHR